MYLTIVMVKTKARVQSCVCDWPINGEPWKGPAPLSTQSLRPNHQLDFAFPRAIDGAFSLRCSLAFNLGVRSVAEVDAAAGQATGQGLQKGDALA